MCCHRCASSRSRSSSGSSAESPIALPGRHAATRRDVLKQMAGGATAAFLPWAGDGDRLTDPNLGPEPESDALSFFDQLALLREGAGRATRAGWVRKWTRPVSVRYLGRQLPEFTRELGQLLPRVTALTGLPFTLSSHPDADLTVTVHPHADIVARFGEGGSVCMTATYGWSGALHTANMDISDAWTDCLHHEFMHALGFDSHWYGTDVSRPIPSTLALRRSSLRENLLTHWDMMAIRALYDSRLAPRMPRDEAKPIAREIIQALV